MHNATLSCAREIRRALGSGDQGTGVRTFESCVRQGDLVLSWIGPLEGAAPAEGAVELAEGRHGAHVALGPVRLDGDVFACGEGAVVVHTDEPRARHDAVKPARPGRYRVSGLRELDPESYLPRRQVD